MAGTIGALTLAACANAPRSARSSDPMAELAEAPRAAVAPGTSAQTARGARPPGDLLTLKAYEVKESAFSDFGMSVKTNFEVRWGGSIEWMVVTDVAVPSSAAKTGLAAGDRIMAIDGRLVTEMARDAMLDALFQRKKGDTSRVLVLGRRDALPRFVTLVANRPGP